MIKLGDTGLIVQYIQNFLKDNYNKNIHLSDEYDKETHRALIEYLQLPEILDVNDIKDLLISTFTYRDQNPPHMLIDGGGIWNFDFHMTPDELIFYNRPINQCLSGAITFITGHIDEVDNLCRKNGWRVANYTTFIYDKNDTERKSVKITLKKDNRKQLLPCKDIINMINFSTNDYLLNKCFLDDNNAYHGFIQNSKTFKIALIPAKPGDTFTIAHGYDHPCEMAIAYTDYTLKEIRKDGCSVENIVSHLSKSAYGEIPAGGYEVYTIPEDSNCTYMLVQMPFDNMLLDNGTRTVTVKIGDINQDGRITFNEDNENSDYMLLKQYVEAKVNGNPLPFTLSGPNLIAANINKDLDINGNPIIDEMDLKLFEAKIHEFKTLGTPIDFGETIYEKKFDLINSDYDKLLVMYGNINDNNVDNELNIPITEYQTNPWLVHDEFLPYILGSAIHKYSDMRDIEWLQEKIREIHPEYYGLRAGYYDAPEDYILNESLVWNDSKTLFEYYKNGVYTGYVLDNTETVTNGILRKEEDMSKSLVEIVNGHWCYNGEWQGKIVLPSGQITKEMAKNSLKEIVKEFQIKCNNYYKYQSTELIKFINGNITPLTEKWLDLL